MMTLTEQSRLIFNKDPLDDDAPDQLETLIELATGRERVYLIMSTEALFAAATPRQLAMWNAEPEQPEQD